MSNLLKNPQILRDAIKATGLSESAFGRSVGIENVSKVSLLLNGKRGVPLQEMARICRALNLTVDHALSAYGMDRRDFEAPIEAADGLAARQWIYTAWEISPFEGRA